MIRLCWVGRFVFLSSGVEIRARFIVLCYLWTDTIGVFVFGLWARGGLVSTVLYSYRYSYSTARYREEQVG